MADSHKLQRIRDPLHNLIEFDTRDDLERALWLAIQTRPFQRLRRIRQLGFSELVYPGATHTRFSHSIGAFHTARQLVGIIRRKTGQTSQLKHQAKVALAAALLHDVGHGMFSHAFEGVGKELKLPMRSHEQMGAHLIRSGEIGEVLNGELHRGFAEDVADLIEARAPRDIYDAAVSSQFDADRLDYMRRDRLMTGVQYSGIDFEWLLANLEVGTLPVGTDDRKAGEIETLVLGPKAAHAAEAYVLALFQLYPAVYFHKATRGAEKVFLALMLRIIRLVKEGQGAKTGLPGKHPFRLFAEDLETNALALDDAIFWGALPWLVEARDGEVRHLAARLERRKLPKCVDIREQLVGADPPRSREGRVARASRKKRLDRKIEHVEGRLREWSRDNSGGEPRILLDRAARSPYKKIQESKGPLNQIRIRWPNGTHADMAEESVVVAAAETFELFRAYIDEHDTEAREEIEKEVKIASEGKVS